MGIGEGKQMPDINVNIDVYCGKCGAGLCHQTSVRDYRGGHSLDVDPCEKCLSEANGEGYEEGLADTPGEGA